MSLSWTIFLVSLVIACLVCYTWFRDITREGRFQGQHTSLVVSGLKWGLVWFLFREVWFFFRVFWRFFHIRAAPLTSGVIAWPYDGLDTIPPFQVPLLNTLILLIRGVTATLAHQTLLWGNASKWLFYSVALGGYFLVLQGVEYSAATYSISSGAYGRIFFFGTGFHGFHVCLGAFMLIISFFRQTKKVLSAFHHFGVEFSLWYWHFVDVVWLFLFFWVYTWGG